MRVHSILSVEAVLLTVIPSALSLDMGPFPSPSSPSMLEFGAGLKEF